MIQILLHLLSILPNALILQCEPLRDCVWTVVLKTVDLKARMQVSQLCGCKCKYQVHLLMWLQWTCRKKLLQSLDSTLCKRSCEGICPFSCSSLSQTDLSVVTSSIRQEVIKTQNKRKHTTPYQLLWIKLNVL